MIILNFTTQKLLVFEGKNSGKWNSKTTDIERNPSLVQVKVYYAIQFYRDAGARRVAFKNNAFVINNNIVF